ncbi:MAG: protein kinase, partial [Anaerolineales bacterium]|nr:protein kinase [Anaerolineales bacterium]
MPALKGQILLNQYRVEAFIASTPLGDLYRAVDIRSEKSFALTALQKNIYEDGEALKEIESRSGKLRGITHPNLIPYLGLHQTSSLAFLLEEWIDGPSLREVLLVKTQLDVMEALTYVKALCGALEVLHKNDFVHLNLAPELIRVNKNGEIFLGGIGAARRVNSIARNVEKTPRSYAAPEIFTSQPLAAAADIYALAVILYQLITAVDWRKKYQYLSDFLRNKCSNKKENEKNCPCSETDCERHGVCCECLLYHRKNKLYPKPA